jgi:hypothetical protein
MQLITATTDITAFEPNRAIFTTALTTEKTVRHMAILYKFDDSWLSEAGYASSEEIHRYAARMMHEDQGVIAYKSRFYAMSNGIYRQFSATVPVKTR